MTTTKTPLTLPSEWEILLTTLEGTDHKVDRLLPLLNLLSAPETEMSDLGQALIDALHRISEDLGLASELREANTALLTQISEMNAAFQQERTEMKVELREARVETQNIASKLKEIHQLMFSPAD